MEKGFLAVVSTAAIAGAAGVVTYGTQCYVHAVLLYSLTKFFVYFDKQIREAGITENVNLNVLYAICNPIWL